MRYVGPQAFRNIKEYLILPKSVVEIGSYAFDDCSEDFVLYFESDKLPEILDDYWNGYLGERYYFYSAEQPTENIEKYWYYDILGLPRLWSDYLKFKELTYTAFGDSITAGYDGMNGKVKMDKSYPELVGENLGLKSVDNQGVSGATLTQYNLDGVVCMTETILSYTDEADIISVMLGVNDYLRVLPLGNINDKSTNTIYGSLNLIAEHLIENYKDSYIFFMTPFKAIIYGDYWDTNRGGGYNLLNVANAVKEVANLYNIDVLDMFELGNYELEMVLAGSDGLHPSKKFYINYTCPQISKFIKKNYE